VTSMPRLRSRDSYRPIRIYTAELLLSHYSPLSIKTNWSELKICSRVWLVFV